MSYGERKKSVRIVIAGGGTGGHLFPGIAVAEEFLRRDPHNGVLFIGTKRGIEHRLLGPLGYELKEIEVEGLMGRGLKALVKGVYAIPNSMLQSRKILKAFGPDVVIGVGGYASGPAVMAACLMRIPTAVAEQNALAGNTNRILGRFVDKIFVTYEQSKNQFSAGKVMVTGNPVRAAFADRLGKAIRKTSGRQILIFGGSQGAAAINKAVVAMLPLLQKMKDSLKIVHQTGERDLEMVKKAYEQYGLDARVSPFIQDMMSAYESSDLIICRAGATSLAEITAAGRASILIPFPWAANDHQTLNARAMVEVGAAAMIKESELTPGKLFALVQSLLADDRKLRDMEDRSRKSGRLDAAAKIVDACLQLAAK
ncbi:MAG: undecaprenyldiphospho-muramoylpentapeptide beta-N-acetylglucosaminyltransferase [Deltaproteobacteria bacterium HGW-Deltaproteobacteria-1]|jgi:UDP-N-acetylglucosamine--N-acetylmuramyl-(pentapeptide) pyrophosphoryl-undecaprenol N-acetylglucosamine transferase|nr:MAG: undecaprenyldiphospho-muramoylpentapeptide beta-N-acetylglucosaminyltransferase [Deltaproteobacteria bacterium HGW-Deltaproteobacteria-1]